MYQLHLFENNPLNKIQEYHEWQSSWSEKNTESLEQQKIHQEKVKQVEKEKAEAEEKNRAEMAETTEKIGLTQPVKGGPYCASSKDYFSLRNYLSFFLFCLAFSHSFLTLPSLTQKRKPGQFIEEGKNRWKAMELKRMQQIILEKKGLRADDLDKRQAPVLKLQKEAKVKKKKFEETVQQKNKIFDDTVNFLFPERNYKPGQELEIRDARDSAVRTEKNEMEALIESVKTEVSVGCFH